ncbi:nuclear mitotic apparatus protein 1-like isoform X1 [Schistocerca piceifrons]|uniref:nuclear mitotic apparatus protein 1-like isoform X1 n=1 Tax=Schistocerca piceifrons TaxID=274613 RepID=UPI001F5F839D|nr:nuclear mitotic apparatus protein 1-like isoform X1 [Schistocerca piceifrons]
MVTDAVEWASATTMAGAKLKNSSVARENAEIHYQPEVSIESDRILGVLDSAIRNMELVVSEASIIFIGYMKQLRNCIAQRLAITPIKELEKQKNLHRIWHRNLKAKADIIRLRDELETQRNEGNAQLAEKDISIQKNEEHIDKLKKHCKDNIKKRINESERNMISDWKQSECRQEGLQIELKDAEKKFENLLSEHLQCEKNLKASKQNVELQLLTVLNKYDKDMGQLQATLEEIIEGFNKEKQQMRELQELFNIQEMEYTRLMTEKAEDEQRELDHKIYIFITNRCARRIQHAWREYKQRKLSKRKGRKKKKK